MYLKCHVSLLAIKSCPCAYAPHHENVWGMEVRLHAFLTSVHKRVDGVQSQSGCGGRDDDLCRSKHVQ
jgi:hypothetical protein